MDEDRRTGGRFHTFVGPDVVEMAVGIDDLLDGQLRLGQGEQDTVRLVARVDDGRLVRFHCIRR